MNRIAAIIARIIRPVPAPTYSVWMSDAERRDYRMMDCGHATNDDTCEH